MTKPQRTWFAVDAVVARDAVAAVETAFDILEADGTETSSLRKKADEDLTVTGFFGDRPEIGRVEDVIGEMLSSFDLPADSVRSVEIRDVVEEDWLAEWKRHWKPTEIGRFVIAPPWSDAAGGKILIRIEPNMAFGTGTHDTTKLCVAAIDRAYVPGESFLDVGTGTGILAIAAAKLAGSGEAIFACDTDIDSVRIARENAAANGVADRIEFAEGELPESSPAYDFVCANLTLDVILPILSLLLSKAKKRLVLSGILIEQEPQIRSALAQLGVGDPQIEHSGEWLAAVIETGH